MKKWKTVRVLFGGAKPEETEQQPFLIESFYEKVAVHLNNWGIGAGEVVIEPPARIRDTDTFKAVIMVLTDRDVPPALDADKL